MAPHASMAYFEAHRSFTFSHDTCRDTLREQELIEFGEQRSDSGVVGGKGGGQCSSWDEDDEFAFGVERLVQ